MDPKKFAKKFKRFVLPNLATEDALKELAKATDVLTKTVTGEKLDEEDEQTIIRWGGKPTKNRTINS